MVKTELNPGEADYRRKTDFDPNRPKSLDAMDSSDVERGLNEAESYANQTPSKKESLNEREENPGYANKVSTRRSSGGRFKGFLKGKANGILPSTGMLAIFTTLGIGGMLLALPASLLTMLESSGTSSETGDHRINTVMHGAGVAAFLSKKKPPDAKGLNKIGTITESGKAYMESKGFTFPDAEKVGDSGKERWVVKEMKFPGKNGAVVKTAAEYQKISRFTVNGMRAAFIVSNSQTRNFRDGVMKKIAERFGIDRSKILKASNNKDKKERATVINQSFDETAKTAGDPEARAKKVQEDKESTKSEIKGKVKTFAKGGSILSAMTALACTSYNTIRATVATVKGKYIAQLALVAMPFLVAASQIRDQGNIHWSTVENLADRLTWYNTDENAPDYNKSAMDSYGLQQIIHGNYGELGEIAAKYSTAGIGLAVAGNALVKNVKETFGQENIATVCSANSAVQLASTVLCAAGPLAAISCVGLIAGLWLFGDDIAAKIVDWIADDAFKLIAESGLGSDLKGVALGNAIAAGIALYMMHNSNASGAQPAKAGAAGINQIKSFYKTSAVVDEIDTSIAKVRAKDNQFDIGNQYSFLGSLASTVSPYVSSDKTAYIGFTNILSAMGASFGLVANSVAGAAGVEQPAMIGKRDGLAEFNANNCRDPELQEAGLACTWNGSTVAVWSENNTSRALSQMNGDKEVTYEVGKQMQDNGFIDEDLKYKDDSEYAKYRKYCGFDREDPPGTTVESISEGSAEDQRWYTMEKCADDDQACGEEDKDSDGKTPCIDNFRYWYNYCERTWPVIQMTENCWSDQEEAPQPASSEGWGCPVNLQMDAYLTQPPHDVGNGTASGVDYSYGGAGNTEGKPYEILAAADGVVTVVGPASGYGTWIQVTHNIDGQKIISYYGHLRAGDVEVKQGDTVTKGTLLGYMGNQGISFGTHLHIGLIYPDRQPTAEDYQNTFMKECKGIKTL